MGRMRFGQSGKGLILVLVVALIIVAGILFFNRNSPVGKALNSVSSNPTSIQSIIPQTKNVIELMLDPASATVSAGQSFDLKVKADTKTESMTGGEIHLTFDPTYLDAISITAGEQFPVVLEKGNVSKSTASITVGTNPTTLLKGTGTVATVTFKAKKAGTTQIIISDNTQVAAIGKAVNALASSHGSSVTIK